MKRIACSILISAFLVAFGERGWAEGVSADTAEKNLPALVAELVREYRMSGVVLVTANGESVFEQAFNLDALQSDFRIKVDSAFTIASITKSFTATLVLRHVSSGKIDLDKAVRAYLPEFEAPYAEDVTVRQLLQNRSGIPHYVDIPGWFDPELKSGFTPESFLARIAALELRFPPGEDYHYSNANYYLLGLILESVTGDAYETLLQEQILNPLGLENTGQIYSPGSQAIAPTYLRDGDTYENTVVSNPILFRATASQYSSAQDLSTFGRALMQGAVLDSAMRDVLLDSDAPMGFIVTSAPLSNRETSIVTYNGELVGATSMLTIFPDQDGTIVILSNSNTPYSALAQMTLSIAELVFAEPSG
ncbi:MAG: serine hydrolase domain-containing protein [Woeseiaceae bacterium]|nr:serine hydrolase domain-containing protein [Woeseiaceae bacterium]